VLNSRLLSFQQLLSWLKYKVPSSMWGLLIQTLQFIIGLIWWKPHCKIWNYLAIFFWKLGVYSLLECIIFDHPIAWKNWVLTWVLVRPLYTLPH
jgi:hypothetical protein